MNITPQEATLIAASITAGAGIIASTIAVCVAVFGWYKVAQLNRETEREKLRMTIEAAERKGQKETLQSVIGLCYRRAVIQRCDQEQTSPGCMQFDEMFASLNDLRISLQRMAGNFANPSHKKKLDRIISYLWIIRSFSSASIIVNQKKDQKSISTRIGYEQ